MIWKKIYKFCSISEFFVDPTRTVNYIKKQNSEKIKDKTQFEKKRHKSDYRQRSYVLQLYDVTLENLRNNECFEFTSK